MLEILKSISIILLLALPPWMIFRGYVRDKIRRVLLILIFILYMAATVFFQNLAPFIVVMIILYFNRKYGYDSEESYYLRPMGKTRFEIFLYSIVFSVIIRLVNVIYVLAVQELFKFQPKPQEVLDLFMKGSWLYVIILVFMTVIFAPILEEFIFRHIIYRMLSKKIGLIWAGILSSLLFTLLHYNIAGAVSFFAVGAYNCYLYEKHGYRAAVLNHFVFNFSSTFLIVLVKALNLNIKA